MKNLTAFLFVFLLIGTWTVVEAGELETTTTEIEGLEVTVEQVAENPETVQEEPRASEEEAKAVPVIELPPVETIEVKPQPTTTGIETRSKPQTIQPLFSSDLSEARQLIQIGEYVKAREALIVATRRLEGSLLDEARDHLAAVNSKLIQQKAFEFPGITEHIVKSGESLYVIAKKYSTTPEWIARLNGIEGTVIYPDQKLRVAEAPISIKVSKTKNRLELYLGEEIIRTFSVATGENASTPVGQFTIVNKLENPTWYRTGAVIPAGDKENILGSRWLGFSIKGFGIHGTTLPESIGTQSTAGCVRMLNREVEDVYAIIPLGASVTVIA